MVYLYVDIPGQNSKVTKSSMMHDLKEYKAGQEPWTKQVQPLVTCRALSTVEIIDHVPQVQNTASDIR